MIVTIHSELGDFHLDIPPFKVWELINLDRKMEHLSFNEFVSKWCNIKDKTIMVFQMNVNK